MAWGHYITECATSMSGCIELIIGYVVCRANHVTDVRAPDNVFWTRNESSGELVWRRTFTRVEMAIRGADGDFDTNYNVFSISELQLFAFSEYAKCFFS